MAERGPRALPGRVRGVTGARAQRWCIVLGILPRAPPRTGTSPEHVSRIYLSRGKLVAHGGVGINENSFTVFLGGRGRYHFRAQARRDGMN